MNKTNVFKPLSGLRFVTIAESCVCQKNGGGSGWGSLFAVEPIQNPRQLRVVVITRPNSPLPRPTPNGFPQIRAIQVEPGLLCALLDRRKENCLLILLKQRLVARRTQGQQKLATGGGLHRLVRDVVLVGLRHEAQIDLRSPDRLPVVATVKVSADPAVR